NNKWDKQEIKDILKNYKEVNFTDATTSYDLETSVEKCHELFKQNGGFYSGDSMPTIPLYHFYFEDNSDPDNKGWFMRVVAETGMVRGNGKASDKFLWQSDKPVAATWNQILHCQYGDLTTDPPFKYQAVRSL